MAAGDDNDVTLHGSFDGSLPNDLQEIVRRLERVESKLDEAGRAGERAGDKIERGADDAAEALRRVEQAGQEATDDLFGVAKAADKAGDQLADVGKSGEKAAVGLEASARGAEGASEALDDTARNAKQAARALDDAGDEAAQAGAKAAASSVGWGKLWAALDRNERITRRWASAQDAMSWDRWTSKMGNFDKAKEKLLNPKTWEKAEKAINKVSKAFGGFAPVMLVGKIMAIVTAVIVLVQWLGALGAGAIGAAAGLGSMAPAIGALLPLLVAGKLAMLAWKAASKELKDEISGIGQKWQSEIGQAVAGAGGLRAALADFDKRTTKLRENVASGFAIIGRSMSAGLHEITDYVTAYPILKQLGDIWIGLGAIVRRFGAIIINVFQVFMNLLDMTMPAAQSLAEDIEYMTADLATWTNGLLASGRGAEVVSKAYDRLKYAIGVVWDFLQGLAVILRIGAQESAWMARSVHDAAQRFDEWTHSLSGQNAIRQWFTDAMPAVRETMLLLGALAKGLFELSRSQDLAPLLAQIRTQLLPALLLLLQHLQGDLLPDLIDLAGKLATLFAGLDFNALTILINSLGWLADKVIWLMQNVPGANVVISTLLTTLLLAGPVSKVLGFLAGSIGKVVEAVKWFGPVLKGGEGLSVMQTVVRSIGRGVLWLAGLLRGPLVQAATWAGRMIAVAFLGSNPVGWIILAIIGLVLAFWWCYDNIASFRAEVDREVTMIGDFFKELWRVTKEQLDNFVQILKIVGAVLFTVLVAPFVIAWNILAGVISWWLDNCWRPFANEVSREWTFFYESVLKPVGHGIAAVLEWLGGVFLWLYSNFIQPALKQAGDMFTWLYNNVIAPTSQQASSAWNFLGRAIRWVYDNLIHPGLQFFADTINWLNNTILQPALAQMQMRWQQFGAALEWVRINVIDPVWNAIKVGLGWVKDEFNFAVEIIGSIWNRLRGYLAKPVNFLINTVWNNGIAKVWNMAADNIPGIPRAGAVAPIPEFAAGGAIRGPGTGTSDSILAAVSNGEHMWTADEVDAIGGHERMLALRSAVRSGWRFADGGAVEPGMGIGRAMLGVASGGGATQAAAGTLLAGWSFAKPIFDGIINPILNSIPFHGPPAFYDIPRTIGTSVRDKLYGWIEGKLNAIVEASVGGGGGTAVPAGPIRDVVMRTAAQFGWGSGPQWDALAWVIGHESGWNPNAQNPTSTAYGLGQFLNGTWATVGGHKTSDPSLQALYMMRYIAKRYGTPIGAKAFWLAHHSYDDGGYLEPGYSTVYNGTGRPEPVFTSSQWDSLDPANLVEAMHATPPSLEARAASAREDELLGAIRTLTGVLAERPPAMAVSGDDARQAVLDALAQRDRERRARDRYRY